MTTLKLLGISGSLRRASTNTGLLRAVSSVLPEGVSLEIADLSEVPFYTQDLTEKPAAVSKVLAQMAEADAFVFACPEYNYSLAPALKNIIDWASREPNNVLLAGKTAAIVGAGGGMGTARSQYHLRQVCVYVDIHVLNKPEFFANAFAGGFDADGNLIDANLKQQLGVQMQALAAFAAKLKR
ncbi:NADPH-dependent FMN reductase [Thiothrix fructosivorans]|jgi:chromate reductase|uniref:NAD(P)H-dependent oxidoreductase n=1 Tax=Thiothrix fructosivorans TaxID=111770 RepID=A0A8B0SEM1_9GAMM|nr:NAD(P)H-dependent oxidoreductase [Thiothrix fructosivorans]MBO0614671.1 NAD(P)H-dependent oxidoreductase [Thiothrix fructosivorans]QTX09494.1 NAD(P)H-dependent oxidoreductase [Thiothrix fructosivorans]